MAKKTQKAKKSVSKGGKKVVTTKKVSMPAKQAEAPIIPLNDRVLVKGLADIATTRTTASGFILPEEADKDAGGKRGRVVAVGTGRFEHGVRVPLSVSVGDTVLYQWGDTISVSGEEYIIVRESEIIAILNA